MAARAGRNARLYVGLSGTDSTPSPLALCKEWSVDWTTDQYDVTAFGDANKKYVTGLPDFKGTFNGFFDDASAQTYSAAIDGASRRFYLYPDITNAPGVNWSGTAFFDFSVTAPVDGPITFQGNLVAAGPVVKSG